MAETLNVQSISQLFETVLQHAKCIEVRIDYARAVTSQQQKYVLTNALNKVNAAVNHICGLLPSSDSVLKVKKQLDSADLVYVMLLTEQLMRIKPHDMEEIVELIDKFLIEKYGTDEQVQSHGKDEVL